MPYRIRYNLNVDYVVAGVGLGMSAPVNSGEPGNISTSLTFYFPQTAQPSSPTFTTADVTNLLNAMVADLSAQMNATATQQKIQQAGTLSAVPPPLGN